MVENQYQDYDLIIFDADGTLRRCTVPGQKTPNRSDQWELIEGVREGLSKIVWGAPRKGRTALGIASNQAGIYYGYITRRTAYGLLIDMIEAAAGFTPVSGSVLLCPHGKEEGCSCRKPAPGMILQLIEFFQTQPVRTLFVGDMDSDRLAAANAGCRFLRPEDFFGRLLPPGGYGIR